MDERKRVKPMKESERGKDEVNGQWGKRVAPAPHGAPQTGNGCSIVYRPMML